MIKLTRDELTMIKKELRGTLDCSFKGDPQATDVEMAGPEHFDLAPTEVELYQRALAKIGVELYQRDVAKIDIPGS